MNIPSTQELLYIFTTWGYLQQSNQEKVFMWQNIDGGYLSAEFRSEVQMLSKVEHLNLVRFLGYMEYEDEHLILVEYVNNGTLRQHLDGTSNMCNGQA